MEFDPVVIAIIVAVAAVLAWAIRSVREPGTGSRRRRNSRSTYGDAGVIGMGAAYGASHRDEDLGDAGGGYVHGSHEGGDSGGYGGFGGDSGGDGGGGGGD
jgi:hypothetical protein